MWLRKIFLLGYVLTIFSYSYCTHVPPSGFHFADSITELTLRYKSANNLIILPFIINDSIPINLILDTGTRNIVLFGKRYTSQFDLFPNHNVQFSGMGDGKPISGKLSLNNKVTLSSSLVGERIAIVLVPKRVIPVTGYRVDGIIGYDIFSRFEVEINPHRKIITFRKPVSRMIPFGYDEIPLKIDCTKPLITASLTRDGVIFTSTFMIDTGSDMAVLLKTTDNNLVEQQSTELIGRGLNGEIQGIRTNSEKLTIASFIHSDVRTEITLSPWHNYGSLGMDILKDYVVIINYPKEYIRLRRI